jgi:hypothetical protein
MGDLAEQARTFASTLTRVVNASVATSAQFSAQGLEGKALGWVWPTGSALNEQCPIPISAGFVKEPRLWLNARILVGLDRVGEHLQVETSVFALCIDDRARPAVRIEYDRSLGNEPDDERPGSHRRAAAHVQIHGASSELSYALAMTHQPPRALEKFHIPVGGKRYRPTLEDFIEFLHAERLLPTLHPGWRDVFRETRGDYLEAQLRAAIRNDQEIAADALRQLGWTVEGEVNDPRSDGNS